MRGETEKPTICNEIKKNDVRRFIDFYFIFRDKMEGLPSVVQKIIFEKLKFPKVKNGFFYPDSCHREVQPMDPMADLLRFCIIFPNFLRTLDRLDKLETLSLECLHLLSHFPAHKVAAESMLRSRIRLESKIFIHQKRDDGVWIVNVTQIADFTGVGVHKNRHFSDWIFR